ncbi:MAG TPA: hypothetical protein QF359_08860, partial [Rhodospirillales bacterium]|nr:hypothetical protein [Rhodospirillales bacterium]
MSTKPQDSSDQTENSTIAVESPTPLASKKYFKRDVIANVVVVALILLTMEVWSKFTPEYIMPSV